MDNIKDAYAEVYYIISLLEEDFKDKLPTKLVNFFADEMSRNYIPIIKPNIPLEEQNLLQETTSLLAMLKLNYWCSDENEKTELLNLLDENEKKYQAELQEKYNPDNLFKNKANVKEDNNKENQTAIIEYKKQNFIIAILNKIRQLFVKK